MNKIKRWMQEVSEEEHKSFAEYLYEDIYEFVFGDNGNIDSEPRIEGSKNWKLLMNCKSKQDVKKWMSDLAGYLVMHIETEGLINNYLCK